MLDFADCKSEKLIWIRLECENMETPVSANSPDTEVIFSPTKRKVNRSLCLPFARFTVRFPALKSISSFVSESNRKICASLAKFSSLLSEKVNSPPFSHQCPLPRWQAHGGRAVPESPIRHPTSLAVSRGKIARWHCTLSHRRHLSPSWHLRQ